MSYHQPHETSGSDYVMEGPHEARRLETKTSAGLARRQLTWAGLDRGMDALDLGCATGVVTRVMASMAHPGKIIGVDANSARLDEAAQHPESNLAIDYRQGDAFHLPLENDSVDFAWSRFLFEYLTDPPSALSELIRVTRPGGLVAVADLDAQITTFHPLGEELRVALERCLRLLGDTGFDPDVGRKLFAWFRTSGLTDVEVDVSPYQVYAGGIPERDAFNWKTKVDTISDLLARRTGDRAYWAWFRDVIWSAIQSEDVFYYSTLILVRGRVPDHKG